MKGMTFKRIMLLTALLAVTLSAVTGGTIAWFTDEVTSAQNTIQTGNLDMELEYSHDMTNWKDVKDASDLFKQNALWEPGHTEYVYLRLTNKGNLAVKYQLSMNYEDTVNGTNVEGTEFALSDFLSFGVADVTAAFQSRAEARAAVPNAQPLDNYTFTDSMTAQNQEKTMALVVFMPETVGNEANHKIGTAAPKVDLSIKLVATQMASESDAFDNQYDANASYPMPWDGTADTSWYNDTDTEFVITTSEQLAGLAELVDGGKTFAGKTLKLGNDIDLYAVDENGERISFNPIGYGYNTVFKGTFDGQGHTIKNLYQNGWALGLDYSTEGGGLFASVVDATIKDLTIDKAEIVMECIDMGALVGYSYGNCTYENITVKNSVIANYNRYTGGVVGEVNGTQTFKNVDVIDSTVSALWGTYDAACGGIIGGKWGDADITMVDCDVSAKLDVFNDACSNYQYYNYRLSGMLIGMSEEVTDGTASASYLTATNCTVTYGDWANYTYCEFEANGKGSYSDPGEWKFSRVQEGYQTGGVDPSHTHDTDESHEELLVFDQLFGGDKGVRGGKTHPGVTVVYPQ